MASQTVLSHDSPPVDYSVDGDSSPDSVFLRHQVFCTGTVTPSREEINKRAKLLVSSFYEYWINREGWRKFVLRIHTLGFKADKHDFVIKELLNKSRPNKIKFKEPSIVIPHDFTEKTAIKARMVA